MNVLTSTGHYSLCWTLRSLYTSHCVFVEISSGVHSASAADVLSDKTVSVLSQSELDAIMSMAEWKLS